MAENVWPTTQNPNYIHPAYQFLKPSFFSAPFNEAVFDNDALIHFYGDISISFQDFLRMLGPSFLFPVADLHTLIACSYIFCDTRGSHRQGIAVKWGCTMQGGSWTINEMSGCQSQSAPTLLHGTCTQMRCIIMLGSCLGQGMSDRWVLLRKEKNSLVILILADHLAMLITILQFFAPM